MPPPCETRSVSTSPAAETATSDPTTTSARATAASVLVRAARRQPVPHTPVWFMRQAGRSLPEYRAIRERHSFFEVANEPELCAEVTLQPVRRHDVDAAVMFADIMTPVIGMGLDVELVEATHGRAYHAAFRVHDAVKAVVSVEQLVS